jgi:hypothetical protein
MAHCTAIDMAGGFGWALQKCHLGSAHGLRLVLDGIDDRGFSEAVFPSDLIMIWIDTLGFYSSWTCNPRSDVCWYAWDSLTVFPGGWCQMRYKRSIRENLHLIILHILTVGSIFLTGCSGSKSGEK